MNTRKQLYLSCLLLLSSAQITFTMHNHMASSSSGKTKIYPQLGSLSNEAANHALEGMNRKLNEDYSQKLEKIIQRGIDCSDSDITDVLDRLNQIDTNLHNTSDIRIKQQLLTEKKDTLEDALDTLDILELRADMAHLEQKITRAHSAIVGLQDPAAYNEADIFNQAQEVPLPQAEPQVLVQPIQQLMRDQEIQTEISAVAQDQVQAQDKALRMAKLLDLAKRHPRVTAGVALAATASSAYLFRKPLAQLGVRAKNGTTNVYHKLARLSAQAKNSAVDKYRDLKSRISSRTARSNTSTTQARKNTLDEHTQLLYLRLWGSMSDEQLRRPGVEALLEMAWQGHIAVLSSPYFNSLLQPNQKELLSALLLTHKQQEMRLI